MAELEDELIGDDLDYEYDLDEEEEEALLAGEAPSHEVDVEDIIEFKVDDEFGGEEDGGQVSHTKSVHSRLSGGPNRLQASGRLQPHNTIYEEERIQTSGRLQPPVYEEAEEEIPQNNLQSSGRLQPPPSTVYEEEEEEIQETYDSTMNDEPVPVHIQVETQNIMEEEEEEEEEEDDGRGRDRFKSERCKTSLVNTAVKRVIPDSLDQVQVKEQIVQQRNHRGGRGRGRGFPQQQRGIMRGRGGRGNILPPYGWPGPRGHVSPLMMNPPNRMNLPGGNMHQGRGGMMSSMGRNIYSLFGPTAQGQNPGNFPLMGNVPHWGSSVGPYSSPSILSHLLPRPQIPPPDDMRNMIKKRSIADALQQGSPNKQMKIGPGPINNQHHQHQQQHQLQQHQHQQQQQHQHHQHQQQQHHQQHQQQQHRQQQQQQHQQQQQQHQQLQQQSGDMSRKAPVMSRLSMPAPNAKPPQPPANVNPNLTTIKTVDISSLPQNGKTEGQKPEQQQNSQESQSQPNATSQPQENKPNESVNKESEPSQEPAKQNDTATENSQPKAVPEEPAVPLTPEEIEYQKKLEQQKKLREEMLAKKEARRKAAAQVKVAEAAKKAEEEKKVVATAPSAAVPETNSTSQPNSALKPQLQPIQTDAPATNKVQPQNQKNSNASSQQQKPAMPPNQQQKQNLRKIPTQQQNQMGPGSNLNRPQPFQGGMAQQQNRGPPIGLQQQNRGPPPGPQQQNRGPPLGPQQQNRGPPPGHQQNRGPPPGHQQQNRGPPFGSQPPNRGPPPGPPQQNRGSPIGPLQQNRGPPLGPSQQNRGPPLGPSQQNRGPPPGHYGDRPHLPQQSSDYGNQQGPYYSPSQDRSLPPHGPPPQNMPPPHHQGPPSHGPPPPSHGPPQGPDQHHPPSDMHRMPPLPPVQRSMHSILSAQRPSPQAILGPPPELPHRPLIDSRDSYSSQSDYYSSNSSRAPPPSHEYSSQYNEPSRSSWDDYPQSYDNYHESYNDRDDYYRRESRDSYVADQRHQDDYRYDSYSREYDDRYRDSYYRESYSYDHQRQGDPRYPQDTPSYVGMKQPDPPPPAQNPHHIQIKLVDNLPKPAMTSVQTQAGQVGQKIQTIQRQPVTNVRKTLYRRITRKNAKGEIISVKKIPVDEHGEQIGDPIFEYVKDEDVDIQQAIPVISQQQVVQDHPAIVKTVRQIVKKVPVMQQQQDQPTQVRIFRQKRQLLQEHQQPIKVVKRTVLNTGEAISPTKTTRRIISSQSGTGERLMQSPGQRRVISAAASFSNTDLPTVQLSDLPSNLHLTDINKLVTGSGVEAPLKVSYVPGSGECFISFRSAEIAAKFYQKMNRRMVNMSVIKASMLC